MPFTFSTESFTRPLAEFGNDSAQMILQTGATIQQGLQQMMTNRQVSALGQQLGQLNPESPEWSQQAVKLGSQYPLAMKSPAGQFMLSTQAKAHAQWQAAQKATMQADAMMKRQIGMENLRTQNDIKLEGIKQRNRLEAGGGAVDLSGLPMGGGPGAAMALPSLDPAANEPVTDAQAPLFGMNGGLEALAPLREAQLATGVKPSRAQVFGAIASERSRAQQSKMQEDRQMQQEKMMVKRDEMKAATDEKKAALAETKLQQTVLDGQLKTLARDIVQHRSALNAHVATRQKIKDPEDLKIWEARKAELEGILEAAGMEQTDLKAQLNSLLSGGEVAAPAAKAAPTVMKKYDPATGTFK